MQQGLLEQANARASPSLQAQTQQTERVAVTQRLPLSIPDFSALREFLLFAGPGFFALLGKVLCYSSMTYAAAAAGTLSLAAHQVVMQVFFFFCNIGDAMSNTAQAFLPGLMSNGDMQATRKAIKTLVLVGFSIGLVDGAVAAGGVVCMGHIFTTSAPVLEIMRSLVGYLAVSLVLHANVVALEGVLFAARQGSYLALAYAASTAIFSGAMVLARTFSPSLITVWSALVLYQVVRLMQFGLKTDAITKIRPRTE